MSQSELSWPFWPLVPLYPYDQRRTLRQEIVAERIWTFDQVQGIFYVVVPIRMTMVRLDEGGLLVYAPVAPTPECLALVQDLIDRYGPIKYILLPTVSGLEHKVFVGPFARQFPQAQVYVAQDQWSFPLNLPLSWLGFPHGRTHRLPSDLSTLPFASQIACAQLGPIQLGLGPFAEVVCFDRSTQSLLVTDTVFCVPPTPPPILASDPYPLLFHARDTAADPIVDTPANRTKGWQRICLFALYFQPQTLAITDLKTAIQAARQAPDRSRSAYFGLYPFHWNPGWSQSFAALCQPLLVAPILQTLILNRSTVVRAWIDRVTQWAFERVIPCHFDPNLKVSPQQFREAFAFLEPWVEPSADFASLQDLEETLIKRKILPPRCSNS